MDIKNLIMCPKCGGVLNDDYKCLACGSQYETKAGVFSVLYENLSEDYSFSTWEIDEEDYKKTIEEYEAFRAKYNSCLSKDCIEAERKQDEVMKTLIEGCSGTILDIATGRGMLLAKIMEWNPKLDIIASDIDARILAVTKYVRKCGANVSFLGTDARHMALKDESVDHVTSFAGIANMPDTEEVISEIYRVLKKNGTFIYKGAFLNRDSDSYKDLKERYHLEHIMDIELLTNMFKKAGFKVVQSDIIASGVWAENPYDGYPFAGDMNNYGIIVVQK